MSGSPKKPRGGKRDNRRVRPDDGRRSNGGARRGAGRAADLAAHTQEVRRLLAAHGHKLTPAAWEAFRTELGAMQAETDALLAETDADWDGEIL